MNRQQVIETLRAHERELKEAGIVRLSLFGSTARGDEGPESDVDLLAAFDESRRLSLLDVVGIELHLAVLLGVRVDLSEEGMLKTRIQQSAEAEALRAF
jgi:predicted nucleotidyltransferase